MQGESQGRGTQKIPLFFVDKCPIGIRATVGKKIPFFSQCLHLIHIYDGNDKFIPVSFGFCQYLASWRDDLTATNVLCTVFHSSFSDRHNKELVFHRSRAQEDFRGFLPHFRWLTKCWSVVGNANEFCSAKGKRTVSFREASVVADQYPGLCFGQRGNRET